jgi:tripartite-type tricarboxylate transporter receptor subunit TctC
MKLPRRTFLQLAAGASALPAASRIARAQTYPTRPVHLIVGFAAGGGPDIVARLIGQWLSERLGQPFVIENRPGAGGNIATEAAVRAPPDGYTLLSLGPSAAINEKSKRTTDPRALAIAGCPRCLAAYDGWHWPGGSVGAWRSDEAA